MNKPGRLLLILTLGMITFCCTHKRTPEEVVNDYTLHISNGEYKQAEELCIEYAKEVVKDFKDHCIPYKTRIDSITCNVFEDEATCDCYESRDGVSILFPYSLKKLDGEWKIAGYREVFFD